MRYAGPRVNLARAWSLASLIVVASWHPAPATAQTQSAAISKERVTFKSMHVWAQDVLTFFAGAVR